MGYYSGSGVVAGGGDQINQFGSLVYNGAHVVYQRTVSETKRYAGVSLRVAKGETAHGGTTFVSSCTVKTSTFPFANLYPFVGCRGSRTDVSYSQIADSNLYEVNVTTSAMSAKGDNGNWIGPDEA